MSGGGIKTRGVISEQQRGGAVRGMSNEISRLGNQPGGGDDSVRLDSKRAQLAALVSRTKDVTNNSYHFVQRMRDVGFTIQFVSPKTNLRALKMMDQMDEERLRVVQEKHILHSHLQQGSGSESSSPSSPGELLTSMHMSASARDAHEKSVHQKKFSLKNQQMKCQIAKDKLEALDLEYAELQKQADALDASSRSVPASPSPSSPPASSGEAPPRTMDEIFNETLLDAASRFFLDSSALPNKNSRLRVLQLVSELCQRPVGGGRPAVLKDPTAFEMIGNQFGDSLASLSSFVLRDTSSVQNISLGNTSMTNSGCAQLALALGASSNAKRLRGLFLGGNEIHGVYAALLLQALRTNPHVAADQELTVDLSGNPLFRTPAETGVVMREVEALRLAKPSITVELPTIPKQEHHAARPL